MDLKKAASTFDVNPAVNYKLLSLLKQKEKSTYDKFITKYKYTLDYRDAKSLNCLNEDENKIILESKRYFNEDIKEINSLSKMKLFNLLFRLFDFKITDEPYFKCATEIKDVLNSYAINETLIFKILNNYGNYELQYYTYLRLFVIYFLNLLEPIFKQNKENKDSNIIETKEDNTIEIEEDNTIEIEEEDIFFDWVENSDGETELVDLTEIEIRKNDLNKFIEENIEKNKNIINMDIEKGENNNDKKEKEKNASEKKTPEDQYYNVIEIISELRKYKEELYYLFKENMDSKIIEQIEFIYFGLLFRNESKNVDYNCYPLCLGNNKKLKNENFNAFYKKFTTEEQKQIFKKDDLALVNIDYHFKANGSNPFYNNAKYFQFPLLLKKNIFETNDTILNHFKEFLRVIYKSKLLEEIFYLTPEFNDFKYPLLDEEILEEMIDNTTFMPFAQKFLLGYTQKQFGKIYVPTYLPPIINSKNDLSKLIIEISFYLNTLIHEQFKHYIKGLLFYNSFRFKTHKRLESDFSTYDEEKYYLDNIRSIFSVKRNKEWDKIIDGGYKAEIYLYGEILYKLYLGEALKMYDNETWKSSVKEHLIEFNKNNIFEPKIIIYSLKEIQDSKKMNNFIKEIIIQFNKFYKCNDQIKFNFKEFGSQKSKDNSVNNQNEFELDFTIYVERNRINIPDTETNMRAFKKLNQ